MKVRFSDPQPGIFPVGYVTFVNGYAEVDTNLFQEFQRQGLDIVACDEEEDTTEEVEDAPTDEENPEPVKRGRGRPRKSS